MKSTIKHICAVALCVCAVASAQAHFSMPTWQGMVTNWHSATAAANTQLHRLDKRTSIGAAIVFVCTALGWALWRTWHTAPKKPWTYLGKSRTEIRAHVQAQQAARKAREAAEYQEREAYRTTKEERARRRQAEASVA